MSILDRLRREVQAEEPQQQCQHANREDLRTMGRAGAASNRWRCRDCGYSPIGVAQ